MLEVKCSFCHRETLNTDEAVTDNDFFQIPIKILKKIANTMHRCSASCDIVVWTPMWLHIKEIGRDVQFMTNVLGTLQNFFYSKYFAKSSNKEK